MTVNRLMAVILNYFTTNSRFIIMDGWFSLNSSQKNRQ